CVYRPKVQVLDNWGWCNGSCDSDGDGNLDPGCYNDYSNPQRSLCDNPKKQLNQDPWTRFKGKIIVIPQRQY
ncbi:MAG: hypothetical protein ABEJ24_04905, partial [Candidatus Magasanikbacteria bacterium]